MPCFLVASRVLSSQIGGVQLYNGAYITNHCCGGNVGLFLPARMQVKNVWFVTNSVINIDSSRLMSTFTAEPVHHCGIMGMLSFDDGREGGAEHAELFWRPDRPFPLHDGTGRRSR